MIRARRLQGLAVMLALVGVLLRGLIPAGFMPAFGDAVHGGAWLMVCDSDAPAMQMRMTPEEARAMHMAMPDPAGGHAQHDGQCPYAAAAAPALPPALVLVTAVSFGAGRPAPSPAAFPPPRISDRLPPVRGPPLLS